MRYMDSLKFVTAKEGWFVNLLMCGVCLFIPVVGQIVLAGYLFEVFDALRRGQQKDYPFFEFNRFSPYLMRGIWIFLVQLLIQMVLSVPFGIMYFVVLIFTVTLAKDAGPVVAVVWIIYGFVVTILSVVVSIAQWAMSLHAGIRQTLDFSGMLAFTKDFVRKMWKETLLSFLFLMACALVLAPVGYLTCCIGFFFIGPFILLAQHHLEYQLYELYLQRGGITVPEKQTAPSEPATAEPAVPPPPPPPSDAIRPAGE